MLKPKYRTLSESVSDFKRMLDGMNNVQPLEKSLHQEMDELVREENELERLDREIIHVENVIAGSFGQLSEAEKSDLAQKYDQMHDKYHSLANRHGRAKARASASGNPALAAKHGEVMKRLRRKGKEYGAKQKKLSGVRNIEDAVAQMESRDPAHMSQYRSSSSALQSFRVLAGLEEQTMLPRDAGLAGTTRHNADYVQMAEGGPSRRRKLYRQHMDTHAATKKDELIKKASEVDSHTAKSLLRKKRAKEGGSLPKRSGLAKLSRMVYAKTKGKHGIPSSYTDFDKPKLPKDPKKESFELGEGGGSRARKADRQAMQYGAHYGERDKEKQKQREKWFGGDQSPRGLAKKLKKMDPKDKKSELQHMRRSPGRRSGDVYNEPHSFKHAVRGMKHDRDDPYHSRGATKKDYARGYGRLGRVGKPKLPKDPEKK